MSTTRPYPPGDRGPEPSGASGASEGGAPVAGASGEGVAAPSGAAGPPGGRQVRRLSFEEESGVVPLARDFTRQALYAWGWLPAASADRRAAAEDVLLVVSELVTNACLHAEGPDQLWIICDNKVIRIEVADRGTGQPAHRTARAVREATACSSSSGCAWTGASSARRESPARRSGRNWARPPDPSRAGCPSGGVTSLMPSVGFRMPAEQRTPVPVTACPPADCGPRASSAGRSR
jgi:hypothetical protein